MALFWKMCLNAWWMWGCCTHLSRICIGPANTLWPEHEGTCYVYSSISVTKIHQEHELKQLVAWKLPRPSEKLHVCIWQVTQLMLCGQLAKMLDFTSEWLVTVKELMACEVGFWTWILNHRGHSLTLPLPARASVALLLATGSQQLFARMVQMQPLGVFIYCQRQTQQMHVKVVRMHIFS